MSLDALPPLREVIARHGLGADKRFGQHYLLDLNLTAKIARLCGDMTGHEVIEVGPGPGGLTRALLAAGAPRLTVIERDARFLPALEEIGAAAPGRLQVIQADALAAREAGLVSGPALLASNLPYNVGTALLIKWLEATPPWWARLVLMFQKEVAERVVAEPGEEAYGRLAILVTSVARARYAFTVPARAFTPPPKVDSAVVVLEPLAEAERFGDLEALRIVTESAFGQRRKTLRRSLAQAAARKGLSAEALLEAADIDPGARAETIPPAGFMRLASAWRSMRPTGGQQPDI